jgi:hypothetical protein
VQHQEPWKVWCNDCKCPICSLCIISTHKGHNTNLFEEIQQEQKQILTESFQKATSSLNVVNENVKALRGAIDNVNQVL